MEHRESPYPAPEGEDRNSLEVKRAQVVEKVYGSGVNHVQEILNTLSTERLETSDSAMQYYQGMTRGVDLMNKLFRLRDLSSISLKKEKEIALDDYSIPNITKLNEVNLLTEDEQVGAQLAGLEESAQDFLNLIELPDEPLLRYRRDILERIMRVTVQRDQQLISHLSTKIPEVYVRYSYQPNKTVPIRSVIVSPIRE